MVGVGIGLSSVGPVAADNPAASTLSLSAGIWFIVSGIVAALAGGFIAGRLSGKPVTGAAGLHGLVSWAVTTLVVLYLLTSAAGGLIGGAFSGVTSTLGGAGSLVGGTVQTAAQAAAPSLSKITNPLDGIEQSVRNQAAGQDPQPREHVRQGFGCRVSLGPVALRSALPGLPGRVRLHRLRISHPAHVPWCWPACPRPGPRPA